MAHVNVDAIIAANPDTSLSKWDVRFLERAMDAARDSKDPSTKVGAALVSPDRTKVLFGYNGFARKMEDRAEWYADRDEKYPRVIHAEMNALILGGRDVTGFTCYTWPMCSCERCFVHLVQAGITRFVAPKANAHNASRWEPIFEKTRRYAHEMGIELIEVKDFPNSF
jgi:dCMP deaminase